MVGDPPFRRYLTCGRSSRTLSVTARLCPGHQLGGDVTPAVLTPAQLRTQLLDARQQYRDAITRGDYSSSQAACRQINRLLDQWPRT